MSTQSDHADLIVEARQEAKRFDEECFYTRLGLKRIRTALSEDATESSS